MTTPKRNPDVIYKIASAEVFAAAQQSGSFAGMPIDSKDGYIHFSTGRQLAETLSLHFKGQRNLVVFAVPTRDLGSKLVWEPSRGGQLFPHVYGSFPMSAVAWSKTVDVEDDGTVDLPEDII